MLGYDLISTIHRFHAFNAGIHLRPIIIIIIIITVVVVVVIMIIVIIGAV